MANDVRVTRGEDGIWVVTYANGDSLRLNEVDFMENSAIAASSNKGKSGMNTLKVHWLWPGTSLCGATRYNKKTRVYLPVLATENVSELTCEKCIAAVVGDQCWIGWQLEREENAQRDAGIPLEQRTTRVGLWNARMYSLPYGALAVFSFLPVEHPARTTDQQAVGYRQGWAYIKTQKQPA